MDSNAASISGVACGGMHTTVLTQPRAKGDLPLVFSMGRGNEGQLGLGLEGVADRVEAAHQARLRSHEERAVKGWWRRRHHAPSAISSSPPVLSSRLPPIAP